MESNHQRIVLNNDGYIIESDNGIFDTSPFLKQPVTEYFLLLHSMFIEIKLLEYDMPTIFLPSVTSNHRSLPGFYDYTFTRLAGDLIEWIIEDKTKKYEQDRKNMQLRNETVIKSHYKK